MPDAAEHECLHPDVVTGWHSLTRWAKILIPIGIGVIVALTGSALDLRLSLADVVGDVEHLEEGRTVDRAAIRESRTATADQERRTRERYQHLSEQISTLNQTVAILTTKLEDDRRRRPR